jgi:hypothetical protein
MRGYKASHTALITSLWLLLVAVVPVNVQSAKKSGRLEHPGVTGGPAVPMPPTAEHRTALVIGNSSYAGAPWMCGGSSAPWKRLRMASISSS